jgi:hypothetical protein
MPDNLEHLLLARLHEVAQIYIDRVLTFMLSDRFLRLESHLREDLTEALFDVTASLSRHSMAVLAVAECCLQDHLPDLFGRLERLSTICAPLGVPPMSFAFAVYRQRLAIVGIGSLSRMS